MPRAKASSRNSAQPEPPKCTVRGCHEQPVHDHLCDEHLRQRRPADWARIHKLRGRREPRLCTEPLRRLTRKTTRGYELIEFARDVLGEPLLPWQEEAAIRGLELNPDGTYRFRTVICLVARQNGKSHLSRTLALWKLYVDGARLVLGVGQDLTLAMEVWSACVDTIQAVPDLAAELDEVRKTNGQQMFRLAGGARYKVSATTRSAGRGLSVDHLNFDEIREQQDWSAWSALSKTTNARARAQTWAISNAGDDSSVVLNGLREAALSSRDPSVGLLEWSAPDGCDLDDTDAWCQANPGLGYTVSEVAIRSALATDPPAVFRTEVLCQRVESLDEAVPLAAWRDCADPAGTLENARERVAACLDVAPDGTHVTLAAAAALPDGRYRTEIVQAWPDTAKARKELPDLLKRVQPRAVAWYPAGPAAALGPVLRGLACEVVEIKGAAASEACQSFSDLVGGRRIVHNDDPLLNAHISGAKKLHQGDGWRFCRRGAGCVDAAYAAAGAVHTAATLPAPVRLRQVVLVPRRRAAS